MLTAFSFDCSPVTIIAPTLTNTTRATIFLRSMGSGHRSWGPICFFDLALGKKRHKFTHLNPHGRLFWVRLWCNAQCAFVAHWMCVKVNTLDRLVDFGLLQDGIDLWLCLVLSMLVCSMGRGPAITLGAPVLLPSADHADFTFTFLGWRLTWLTWFVLVS